MSDQQQTPLHKWEIVSKATRARMRRRIARVPGGWLYRYQPNITSPPSSMAFVPDPASQWRAQRQRSGDGVLLYPGLT